MELSCIYQEGISGECSCENHEKLGEAGFQKRICLSSARPCGAYMLGHVTMSVKALKFSSITLN